MCVRTKDICDIIGQENFYIELQYHGLPKEAYAKNLELLVAKAMHIKLCVANDAHYVRKEDWERRKMLETLKFDEYRQPGADETEY